MKLRHKLSPAASRGGRIWHNGGGSGWNPAGYSSSLRDHAGQRAKLRRDIARRRRQELKGKRKA